MRLLVMMALFLLVTTCFVTASAEAPSFRQIDQETAKEMMKLDDGHIVVDVRTQEEYAESHIPGAVCIPNELIGCDPPEALPDYDQIILIYCRSGRRSKEASQKLAGMGYTNIYEFGGINTWTGDVIKVMKISVKDGVHTIIYQLNDSPSAQSLYRMLPLKTEVENYGSNEKIFYPEKKLSTENGIESSGEAGGLALFSPWGNVVMYYDHFDSYPGLYILGYATEGADLVKNLSGTIYVEALK